MIRQGMKVLEITDETPKQTDKIPQPVAPPKPPKPGNEPTEMMVDKYKPQDMAKIIGMNGAQSPANKLHAWLKSWRVNMQKNDFKAGYNKGGAPNPAVLKAALLSGPPGIGKTTTANLVAKALGFNVVEYNASSVRSKKLHFWSKIK